MTLDTNVIIYYVKKDQGVVDMMDDLIQDQVALNLSAVSVVELMSFEKLEQEEVESIDRILSTLRVVSLEESVARLAGLVRRSYGLRLPDAVITATALLNDRILITRNVRDFRKIPDLKIQGI